MTYDAVVFPDIHAPKQCKPSLKAAIKFLAQIKPKYFIHLGDLCDFNSLSRYDILGDSELISFNEEVKSANEILDDIQEASPHSKHIFIEGNHDKRPEIYRLNSWDRNFRKFHGKDLEDCFGLFHMKKRGWETRRYGEFYELGKCLYSHGYFVGSNHAKKTVTRFFKTMIYGHTHEWQVHSIVGLDRQPVAGISIGTLSRLDLSYLNGVPSNWTNMIAYVEYSNGGEFTPHTMPIINGHFNFHGTRY